MAEYLKKSDIQENKGFREKYGLEGDGVVENFFNLIWTKNPLFSSAPTVNIPDTVIISHDEPLAWYFMEGGIIKRKSRNKMKMEYIREKFLRHENQSGIVAQFMRYIKDHRGHLSSLPRNLREILVCSKSLQILKEKKNHVMRCYWSPKMSFFEKIESQTSLYNKNFDVYDRAITFEAEEFHSNKQPIRGYVMPEKIKTVATSIAQHLEGLNFEEIKVARMVLNFKLDQKGKFWFLFCSSFRLDMGDEDVVDTSQEGGKKFDLKHAPMDFDKFRSPQAIKTDIIKGKPVNMELKFECTDCGIKLCKRGD